MLVPETTMHEDDLPPDREHKVRRPGQIPPVQAVPVAHCMQLPPHRHLGPHAFRPNARHDLAPALRRHRVDHPRSLSAPRSPPNVPRTGSLVRFPLLTAPPPNAQSHPNALGRARLHGYGMLLLCELYARNLRDTVVMTPRPAAHPPHDWPNPGAEAPSRERQNPAGSASAGTASGVIHRRDAPPPHHQALWNPAPTPHSHTLHRLPPPHSLGGAPRCCRTRESDRFEPGPDPKMLWWPGHGPTDSFGVCSPSSRRVAALRPRFAGLSALTTAPRAPVQTGRLWTMPNPDPLHVVVDHPCRFRHFRATVDTRRRSTFDSTAAPLAPFPQTTSPAPSPPSTPFGCSPSFLLPHPPAPTSPRRLSTPPPPLCAIDAPSPYCPPRTAITPSDRP